MQGRQLRVLL